MNPITLRKCALICLLLFFIPQLSLAQEVRAISFFSGFTRLLSILNIANNSFETSPEEAAADINNDENLNINPTPQSSPPPPEPATTPDIEPEQNLPSPTPEVEPNYDLQEPEISPISTTSKEEFDIRSLSANLGSDGVLDSRAGVFAFPGAEGWGSETRGGAGGNVYVVNTTEDIAVDGDGLISLREALESMNEVAPGKRIIVFSVGGLFDITPHPLNGHPWLNWPRILMQGQDDSGVTVACQTAPSPGVNIRGGGIYMWNNVTDHIWRHCTKRNDDELLRYGISGLQDSNRTFSIDDFGGNMIFDHMSLSWSTDNNWHVYVNSGAQSPNVGRFTVSHSIVAEGDGSNPTTPGTYDSAQGPACLNNHLTQRIEGCSFLYNYFAHNETRNGALWGATGESLNNIIYNYRDQGVSFYDVMGTGHTHGHAYNNLIKEGLDGPGNSPVAYSEYTQANNNYRQTQSQGTPADAVLLPSINTGTPDVALKGSIGPDIRQLAAAPDTAHMGCLGASKPTRDAHDEQYIQELFNGTGRIFRGPIAETRDYSIYPTTATQHPPNYDTDNDGIADDWERLWVNAGLIANITQMDHLTDTDNDGYLDIEEFVNELARCPGVEGFSN